MARVRYINAFLNIPYDLQYSDLYLAWIAGSAVFGLNPRATLEIPGGARRLDRIFDLVTSCRYSFHDLSRVELDANRPLTPRFNMPFELGLVIGWTRTDPQVVHTWYVFESKTRRLSKSLSDLNGTDPYIHDGKPKGVFRELGNALVRSEGAPTLGQFDSVYKALRAVAPSAVKEAGAKSIFEARTFKQLVVLAREYSERARTR